VRVEFVVDGARLRGQSCGLAIHAGRTSSVDTNKSKNIKTSATRLKKRTGRKHIKDVVKNYTCGEDCTYAAGSNNITGYLVVITEIEGIKTKTFLNSEYIRNYVNLK
jgi:hypothetical protein